MPDGVGAESRDAPEPAVPAAESRLLRRVRINLSLWSGGITLAVLIVLGVIVFVAVERSLAAAGVAQLTTTAGTITGGRPNPEDLGAGGFRFGGPGSGTFSLVASASGDVVIGDGPFRGQVPEGLPLMDGIQAAAETSARDIRNATIGQDTPVRVLTDPVSFRGRVVYLQVVGDRTTEQRTLAVLVVVLVVGGFIALLVATGAGAVYASRALVPIRRSLGAQREALRRQREFAADASHELRTPLTVIRASVDDLERHRDQPVAGVGSALSDIQYEVDHLTAMVEDLLLLARSDSGALELERVPVDLGDVASDAASSLSKVATDRGVTVLVDPEPAEVRGDPARLRQVVVILLDNAIRHSPTGGDVRLRVRADGPAANLVVEDQGPGIAPEDLPRVFDRFYRAAGAPGGGTGLGLAIASWIVEHHDGRIEAANVATGGARFTATIPLARAGMATA
jgi:two-component system, OmpR family, sensor histidine kinase CiaH